MKSPSFEYLRASSLDDLNGLLAEHGEDAKIIAGGQSLVPSLNMRLSAPSHLIDINGVDELKGISVNGEVLHIGALTRHFEVAASAEIATHAPLLSLAVPHIAHEAIRSRGTLGGSLANADPAAEFPACMLALAATLNIASAKGTRSVPAADFFQGIYETALQDGEVLTSIDIPVIGSGYASAFDELTRRHGDYALVGLAAHANTDGGTLSDVRLAFFSIGDRAILAKNAAAALEGKALDADTLKAAQAALGDDLDPMADLYTSVETKMHLARVLMGRVVNNLTDGGA